MTAAYVDASALLARILHDAEAVDWRRHGPYVASQLMRVEALRTIDRLRVSGKLPDDRIGDAKELIAEFLAGIEQVPLTALVLDRAAAPFSTVVHTLDAIHLATAVLWAEEREEPLVFLTHDRQLSLAARACGFQVAGVRR